MEAGLPAENTIARGWMPYGFENTPEGKELARLNTSPLDSLQSEANLAVRTRFVYYLLCNMSWR